MYTNKYKSLKEKIVNTANEGGMALCPLDTPLVTDGSPSPTQTKLEFSPV